MANEVIQQNDFRSEVANPFGKSQVSPHTPMNAVQVSTREMASAQAKIFLAKQFPRDQPRAMDQILVACQRTEMAIAGMYRYPRGKDKFGNPNYVSGPSIRLAEEIARCWGNIECGWTELDRTEDISTARAYAWDLEFNLCKEIVFKVPLQRSVNREGGGKIALHLSDERDIYEAVANQASRRLRNCILSLIPGDVVDAAVNQCKETVVSKVDLSPKRIKDMVEEFGKLGVTKTQIEGRIQRKVTEIEPTQFLKFMEIYRSLKDGMSDVSDWFEVEPAVEVKSATDQLKTKLLGETTVEAKTKKEVENG